MGMLDGNDHYALKTDTPPDVCFWPKAEWPLLGGTPLKQTSGLDSVKCLLSTADSVGRRHTCVKTLCRGFVAERFAWPLIKLSRDLVQARL
jgi:hypothetical protein